MQDRNVNVVHVRGAVFVCPAINYRIDNSERNCETLLDCCFFSSSSFRQCFVLVEIFKLTQGPERGSLFELTL